MGLYRKIPQFNCSYTVPFNHCMQLVNAQFLEVVVTSSVYSDSYSKIFMHIGRPLACSFTLMQSE